MALAVSHKHSTRYHTLISSEPPDSHSPSAARRPHLFNPHNSPAVAGCQQTAAALSSTYTQITCSSSTANQAMMAILTKPQTRQAPGQSRQQFFSFFFFSPAASFVLRATSIRRPPRQRLDQHRQRHRVGFGRQLDARASRRCDRQRRPPTRSATCNRSATSGWIEQRGRADGERRPAPARPPGAATRAPRREQRRPAVCRLGRPADRGRRAPRPRMACVRSPRSRARSAGDARSWRCRPGQSLDAPFDGGGVEAQNGAAWGMSTASRIAASLVNRMPVAST